MAEKVKSLFKSLLKKFDTLHSELAAQESSKIKAGDYNSAQSLLSDLKTVAKYRTKVEELSKGWQLNTSFPEQAKITKKKGPDNTLKMHHFKRPILEFLSKQPVGRAKSSEVMEHLKARMKMMFTVADTESDKHNCPKWQKAANFCRLTLKHEGLIKEPAKFDRGFWEITEQGRAWVATQEAEITK